MLSPPTGTLGFLLIVSALHLKEGVSKHVQFGCEFDDKDYNLKVKHDLFAARFGKQPDGLPEKNFRKNFQRVEEIFTDFLETNLTFDTMGSIVRFYQDYEKLDGSSTKSGFKEFFRQYSVKIGSDDEPVGNILTLMKQIASKSLFGKNAYLVTASHYFSLTEDKDKPTNTDEPSYWGHTHVAGMLKFLTSSAEKTERAGYVLLDPKYLTKPVIIMEDGGPLPFKHEYSESMKSNRLTSLRLHWYPEEHEDFDKPKTESNYIIGRYDDRETIAYFFKHPYCTFVEHTVKPSLLNPERAMMRFNKKEKLFQVTVTILQDNQWPFKLDFNIHDNGHIIKMQLLPLLKKGQRRPVVTIDNQGLVRQLVTQRRLEQYKEFDSYLNLVCPKLPTKQWFERDLTCSDFWVQRMNQLNDIYMDTKFTTNLMTLYSKYGEHRGLNSGLSKHWDLTGA